VEAADLEPPAFDEVLHDPDLAAMPVQNYSPNDTDDERRARPARFIAGSGVPDRTFRIARVGG
jgi:hypothetical protein